MANYDKLDVTAGGVTRRGLPKRHAAWFLLHTLCMSGVDPSQLRQVLRQQWKLWEVAGTMSGSEFAAYAADHLGKRKGFDPGRWFLRDEELVHSGGHTFAISNQWGTTLTDLAQRLDRAYPQYGIVVRVSTG